MARRAAAVRSLFGWAHETDLVATDPSLRLVTPKRAKTLPVVASQDGIRDLLDGQRAAASGGDPVPLRDHAMLEDWHRARYHVLPGMTGLWQISGRSGLEFDDLVRLDFTYIEQWSIWTDVSIIAKTIPAVIAGRGAY